MTKPPDPKGPDLNKESRNNNPFLIETDINLSELTRDVAALNDREDIADLNDEISRLHKIIEEYDDRLSSLVSSHEEDLSTMKLNYDNAIIEKDKTINSQHTRINDLVIANETEITSLKSQIPLRKYTNHEDKYSIKTSRKKKGSNSNLALPAKCEFNSCDNVNVDLVKCCRCEKWVCEKCNDVPVSKLKLVTDKCPTVYFVCKQCDNSILTTSESEQQMTHELRILKQNENNHKDLLNERENTIDDLHMKIKDLEECITPVASQQDAINQSTNVQNMFSQLESKIEQILDRKLDEKMETMNKFSETIVKEVKTNKDGVVDKLEKVMSANKTFAESVAKSTVNVRPTGAGSPEVNDFRAIMNEQRNMELNEANERKSRASNIIIHGVSESGKPDKDETKKHDVDFIQEFLRVIGVNATIKSTFRLGKPDDAKKRPIKVITANENEKDMIMANLKRLKDQDAYRGISITDDYTINERNLIRSKAEEAKKNNEKEPADSQFIWRVRGTPKNGLTLKKFRKPQVAAVGSSLMDLM